MLTIVPDALSKHSGGDRFGDQTIWVAQQSYQVSGVYANLSNPSHIFLHCIYGYVKIHRRSNKHYKSKKKYNSEWME
jgi:hypothetical protein